MAEKICCQCGTVGNPKRITKGSILIELVLWLCFIVPGLIYSLWRLTSVKQGCPACGGAMIPLDTPRGREMNGARFRDASNADSGLNIYGEKIKGAP